MPFGQYVASSFLNHALLQMNEQEGRDSNGLEGRLTDSTAVKRSDNYGISIAEGEEEIELGVGASKGKKLFSREISHGLGMGRTTIILSQEGTETKEAYFGVPGIFKADLPQIELEKSLREICEDGKRHGHLVPQQKNVSGFTGQRFRIKKNFYRKRKNVISLSGRMCLI